VSGCSAGSYDFRKAGVGHRFIFQSKFKGAALLGQKNGCG
jgi:hypothetical protein